MPPRRFLSTHPFFEGGPINGRKQANSGFMRALLNLDPFDEYHFFVDDPEQLQKVWKGQTDLAAVRRHALKAHRRWELVQALHETAFAICHLSDPIDGFVRLAACRNRLAAHMFPMTTHNHTLSYARYAANFQEYIWNGWGPADAIGCNSQAALGVMQRIFARLNDSHSLLPSLHVMHMGADCGLAKPDGEKSTGTLRKELNLARSTVLVLYFGRFSTVDKVDPLPLLLAMRRAQDLCPQQELCLVLSGATGDNDPVFAMLPIWAKRLGLCIRLLPNPSLERKSQLFAESDIFVSPSDNIQETFGLTLVEAFAAGLAVIASDWDGYRDIVQDQVNGILVPTLAAKDTPVLDLQSLMLFDNQYHLLRAQSTCVDVPLLGRAIALLAADPQLRKRLGAEGRRRVEEHFSWKCAAKRWLALWENLASLPLEPADEERMRSAVHPQYADFGRIFSFFASAFLADDDILTLTVMGNMLLHAEMPWDAFAPFRFGFPEDEIRPLLFAARKSPTCRELWHRSKLTYEQFERYVLWCLKHDLLQRTRPKG